MRVEGWGLGVERTSKPWSDSGDCDGATHAMSMRVGSVQVMSTEVGLFGTPRNVSAAGEEAGDVPTCWGGEGFRGRSLTSLTQGPLSRASELGSHEKAMSQC